MKKNLISMLLIVALIVTMAAPTFAETSSDNKITSVEEQAQLLHELQGLIQSSQLVLPRSLYGLEMPNINLISTPSKYRQYFLIGLEIEHDLIYGEWERMDEITSQPVNEEIVDFILSFTGIPKDNAFIAYSVILRTPLLPCDYVVTGICPVWGYDRTPVQYDERATPANSSVNLRMGNLFWIDGVGTGTIGNQRNSAGSSFNAALHSANRVGLDVFLNVNRTFQIGRVSRSVFNLTVDAAEINVSITGSRVLHELPSHLTWPGGNNLRYHAATARLDDQVRSIRGISGVSSSRVFDPNATVSHLHFANMILIYPDGNSQPGDSGAALIRVSDSAAVGIRSSAVGIGGRRHGLYTSTMRF